MEETKRDKMREMPRHSLRISAIAVVISAGAFINVSKNSGIRAVEIVTLLALGISIGVFLMNLMLVLKLKDNSPEHKL